MDSPTIGNIARWFLKPIGWPSHLLAGVAALLALWGAMPPGGYSGTAVLSIGVWLLVILIWAGRAIIRLIVAKRRQEVETLPGGWKPWIVAPLLLLGTWLVLYLQLPFYAGFLLSRGAMERSARQAMSASARPSFQPPQRIGLYWTRGPEATPWGMKFGVNGAGFLETDGFAYSSHGTPPSEKTANLGFDSYKPIMGNWYEWHHDEDW